MVSPPNSTPLPVYFGRPIGLVLGAGGIRGCAHAGVLTVLREADIPIDVVVGTSAGALFGLAVAAGLPVDYIARVAREATPLDMMRFYLGRLRVDRKNPIACMVHRAGDGRTFADLQLPFAVTATDMETGRPVLLNSGPVLRAVEASIALPFVARPAQIDGRVLADGGLLDTAPAHVARAMGAHATIVVCLGHNYSAPRALRTRPWTRSVLLRLGQQHRPASASPIDQVRFAMRLTAASFHPPQPGDDADVLIWPYFGRLSPNSPYGAAFCYEQGVRAAQAALPRIRELVDSE